MHINHDNDHFVESVGEQLLLMLWTSIATLTAVGVVLWIALQWSVSDQRGSTMNIVWKAELSREMMTHLSNEQQHMLMRRLTEVVDKTAEEFMVGREFKNGLRTTA